jgi:hypothetical protein
LALGLEDDASVLFEGKGAAWWELWLLWESLLCASLLCGFDPTQRPPKRRCRDDNANGLEEDEKAVVVAASSYSSSHDNRRAAAVAVVPPKRDDLAYAMRGMTSH